MNNSVEITGVKMPAGKYWVGDPCYSVPDDRWIEWLEAADYTSEPDILFAKVAGRPVLGIGTAYGDGEYTSNLGHSFPVDAGLIGVTPVELVKGEPFGSTLVEFNRPFECRYDEGTIILGHIKIDTDPKDDEYEGWYS
jgi:hypothetical protein